MAKPRVFISSTFYDLRQIREDIERFVAELGYEPIRNETGAIPYSKDEAPEQACYREVSLCDIIVTIIGGRYGTESNDGEGHSITQKELKTALLAGIQVFIFIEESVMAEYGTFKLNKDNETVKYRSVDDIRVFQRIEELYNLPKNNAISPFQTCKDIVEYLRAQWAGLFQMFLSQQQRTSELETINELRSVSQTLHQTLSFLQASQQDREAAIQRIIDFSHPAYRSFARVTKTSYRVSFLNLSELTTWLKSRSFFPVPKEDLDHDSVLEWVSGKGKLIKLTEPIFDEAGALKPYTEDSWLDSWVTISEIQLASPNADENSVGNKNNKDA